MRKPTGFSRASLIIAIAPLIVGELWLSGCTTSLQIQTLANTKGFIAKRDARFTISPDGNLFLYPAGSDAHTLEALTLLDVRAGMTYELLRAGPVKPGQIAIDGGLVFNLPQGGVEAPGKDQYSVLIIFLDLDKTGACWTPDSRVCIIPAPSMAYGKLSPSFVVDASDRANPKLVKQTASTVGAVGRITYADANPSGKYSCSDCDAPNPNLTLLPKADDKTQIGEMRASPDGKYIAYQITTYWSGFARPPDLHLVNTATKVDRLIAHNVYYAVHWAPDSHRLYFYMCKVGGSCNSDDAWVRYVDL